MSAHAVGGRGVKAVVAEEPPRGVRGQNLPVKKHAHHIRVTGAELHVMRDHNDGDALSLKLFKDLRKSLFKEAVNAKPAKKKAAKKGKK